MRVRYQPICCVDELVKSRRRSFLSRNCYRLIILLSVIVLISLYSAGIFSYLFEEDFTKFKYPLEIENVNGLIEKIDGSLVENGDSPRVLNYTTIAGALDRIEKSDSRWIGIKPVPQFLNLSFLLDVRTKCEQQWSHLNHASATMIIVVKSAVNNYARRSAIRDSWYLNGTIGAISFKTAFMVGACHEKNPVPSSVMKGSGSWSANDCNDNIVRESANFGDIIQSSGIDSYYNNTVKSFMTLRWLSEHCQSDFVLLIDDDYVLEIENLLDFMIDLDYKRYHPVDVSIVMKPALDQSVAKQSLIRSAQNHRIGQTRALESLPNLSKDYLYAGYLRDYVHPMRVLTTKWYITRKEYAYNKYPRFITGGAMLMTHKTVKHMHFVSYFTNAFKFDDVYIGILARKLGIEAIHADSFMCTLEDYMEANPTRADATTCIGVHDIEPADLAKLWQTRRKVAKDDSNRVSHQS